MIVILREKPATKDEIKKMAYEFGSYIKVVVDIEKEIVAGGSAMHYDEEQELLEYGCQQKNLWGGGIDLETNEITYDSMINIRPNQDNDSREIQSKETKERFKKIVERFLTND